MNKIYKVIWSKAKHCYVVVSELAKNHTKGCGRRSLRRTAVSLGIVATLLGGFSNRAWAALGEGTASDGSSGTVKVITYETTGDAAKIVTTDNASTTLAAYTLNNAAAITAGTISGVTINGATTISTTGNITGATITASTLMIGETNVGTTVTDINTRLTTAEGSVSNLNTKTRYISSPEENKTTIAGTLDVTGAATVGSLTIGTTLTIGTAEVDTAGLTGTHTIASDSTGYVSGATVNTKLADYTKNSAAAITGGSISGVTISASSVDTATLKIGGVDVDGTGLTGDHTTIGTGGTGYVTGATVGTELANYAKADGSNVTAPSTWATKLSTGVINATGQDHADELIKGSTVYDYLNGTTLTLGADNSITSTGTKNTAIGYNNTISDIAGDSPIISMNLNVFGQSNSIKGSKDSVIIGNNNKGTYNNTVGPIQNHQNLVVIGNNNSIADKSDQSDIINNAIAIGEGTTVKAGASIAIGKSTEANGPGIAIGEGAKVQSANSIAIGGQTEAGTTGMSGATQATSVGGYAKATGWGSAAFGQSAKAENTAAVAIGSYATASGFKSIAIGGVFIGDDKTTASGDSSIAIGKSAEAKSEYTIAMGTNAKVASGTGTIAIGYNANASGNDTATAIGRAAKAWQGTAIGWDANANGEGATALGSFTNADSKYATAVGSGAKATWNNAVALGHGAEASIMVEDQYNPGTQIPGETESATALGAFSKAQSNYATAVGANAKASGLNSIAIGGGTRPDTGTITAATAVGEGSIAIGKGAKTTAAQATAVGMNTSAVDNGTAIGYNARANKNTSTAIGYGAKADGNGENATAIGYDSSATGHTSIAIAGSASASLAIAVGRSTSATAERAIGIGVETAASGIRSVAIGSNTSATVANSVALGSNSVANRTDYATTNYNAYLNEDGSKTDSAWRSTHGAVSVGDDTSATKVTRQITGVAAGTKDTDAVNVAQLKSATPVINSAHNYYVGTTTAGVKVTDAVNAVDAALGKVAAGSNYLAVYDATTPTGTFAENLTALDTAIGKVTSDGNYIKESSTKNVAENLSLLDAQAKTNADNIGTLQTKTQNITATAGTTIMEGVLNVVPAGGTTGIAISGTDKTITGLSNITWNASAITSGRAATEDQLQLATSSLSTTLTDTGLQFGANLNTATNNDTVVTNKLGSQVKVLGGGAQSGHTYSAANVTTEITQEAGNSTIIIKLDHNPTFGNISGASLAVSGMLSSASLKVNNIDVTTPLTTPGAVASGHPGFVIGGTVYSEVRPTADGNYVKTANTTAANLTVLDTQVKTNADNITALQSSTTAAVGTLTEDGNYIKKSSTNNIVQNLSALDTQVKTNTDDIATLKNSISVQEDASGTKTTTIEGNLVIKEEDGTTKDVTAALSTDGEVAKQGDAGSEGYLKGETVYDYLNKGDNGKEVKLATESQQISMGKGSEATGAESIAIGNEVGTQKNQATGTQSIAIGFGNQVSGNHSGAIGDPTYIAADNSYAIGNSNNITATGTRSFAIGNNNTIGGSDTFVLGSNVNTNAANAVVLGNNSTGEANAVSVGSVGGERQIKHVAPGTDANDAATVGQLGALAQAADNGINRLDSKVNKVGAGAAALAALHPIDTDDKFTMGLGYGNYRNAHSAAIGLFYRPTEKVMISVGGTLGNGENMINAGISFALDKGKGFGTSKAMMARKIAAQEEKITQQDAKIQSLEEENAKLAARLAAIEEKLAK